MEALILGVGDAFTRVGYGSSALLRSGEGMLLLDCPDPIHRVLAEAADHAGWTVEANDIHDIVLTHLHADHAGGLESFLLHRMLRRLDRPDVPLPRLHCDRRTIGRVWEKLAPALDAVGVFGHLPTRLEDFVDPRPLDPGTAVHVAGIRVECRPSHHPVPTLGFRFFGPEWSLGWSGDTSFDREHVDWLSECDRVVHESNLGPAHTPIEDLNRLEPELRAKLRLIHLPDDFDPATSDIEPLRAGEILGRPR